jgi:hypothetical protein
MTHNHNHGIGGWVEAGIGLGIGLAIFHFIVVGLAFVAVGLWLVTAKFSPFWRAAVRGILVTVAICAVLLVLVMLLGE